ncbi:unnamed protein product [Schistosoma curassoni]|uniref:Uncharacterized protein n=1 Tax=Schistosoma curassoni TaxID=6186 RepID=A0A183K0V6_9TREM|nr:unnamed protein product [Schistosoma curassoni]
MYLHLIVDLRYGTRTQYHSLHRHWVIHVATGSIANHSPSSPIMLVN